MARPTTEIVKVPLKPGIDIDDADSPAGKVLHDTFITLQQQDGFQRLHKGLQVENPSILQVYIGTIDASVPGTVHRLTSFPRLGLDRIP